MYNFTYDTRYGDYKNFDVLKMGAVLDIIQDIAIKDSTYRGYGIHEMRKMSMAWLLQGIKLHIDEDINTISPVKASTAVRSLRGVSAERGCILEQDGKVVARSIAHWFLYDVDTNRICKVPEEMQNVYEIYDFDDFYKYKKLATCDVSDVAYTVKVANKDIDTNKHLNNQKGAEMLMDALPYEFTFNELEIIYKKPAYLGDTLEACIKELEDGYYVHLQKDGDICLAGTFRNV